VDDADHAQAWEERERDASIQRALHRNPETPLEIKGKRVCCDCEEPIPKKRLQALPGTVRCASCQNVFEKRQQRSR